MEDIIARLEIKRIRVFLLCIATVPVAAAGLAAGLLLFRTSAPNLVVFTAAAFAGLFYLAVIKSRMRDYKTAYKRELVEKALLGVFADLVFRPEHGISRNVIAGTGMMMLGNRYASDDYIRGSYKSIGFEQSDVLIQNVTRGSKGRSYTVTYFKGRWMIFEFNKSFKADLQVRESGFSFAKKKGGWFAPKEEKMAKIELEDTEFNEKFDVYAQNEHEAYYILTPHIMESIKKLSGRTDGKMLLCFVDSKLHVGVNSGGNAFEPPVMSGIDRSVVNRINHEISLITRFVDELDIDRDIFK